ncbi:protein phosphatase 1 regulatory subunit 21-like [Clytia hemisphaerica]|uniref:protein phosphatase 1 regulatory subunit 21-like n=1 Tax=Clytia hemisphaerica TaxID=252671 RepID=UPI0034D66E48
MWSENLEKTNNNLLKEEKKIVSLFTRLVNYLSIISNLNLQESSFTKCVENIANILNVLSGCFHAIYELYVMKSKEEHNLPTYTDRLKTTDDCLLTTVHSLSSTATKLKSVFQQNVQFMTGFHGFKRKGLPSDDSQVGTL